MQNTSWSNKIENWTWSAVNTLTESNNGSDYYSRLTPSQIYLHEMNRNTKTNPVGEWTTPTGKIGLMYASDYALCLGDIAKNMNESTSENGSVMKTGWIHVINNNNRIDTFEWIISQSGYLFDNINAAWSVSAYGYILYEQLDSDYGIRPVFYLTDDVKITDSGDGSLENPFIITE